MYSNYKCHLIHLALSQSAEIREYLDSITERFLDAPWLLLLVIFFCVYYQSDYCVGAQSKSNKFSLSLSLEITDYLAQRVQNATLYYSRSLVFIGAWLPNLCGISLMQEAVVGVWSRQNWVLQKMDMAIRLHLVQLLALKIGLKIFFVDIIGHILLM